MFTWKAKFLAIAIGLSWLAGASMGAYAVWQLWDISNLQANLRKLEEDAERVKKVLSINQKTDDTTARVERDNQLILEEIAKLQERAFKQPAIAKGTKDESSNSANDYVCVDTDSMRAIGKLR